MWISKFELDRLQERLLAVEAKLDEAQCQVQNLKSADEIIVDIELGYMSCRTKSLTIKEAVYALADYLGVDFKIIESQKKSCVVKREKKK